MVEAPPVGPVLPPRRRKTPRVLPKVMDGTEHSGPFPPAGKEELYPKYIPTKCIILMVQIRTSSTLCTSRLTAMKSMIEF